MRIEEIIKQTAPFKGEKHRVVVNLAVTQNWIAEKMNATLKEFDLTIQQFNVLRILRGAGKPISTSNIRERMVDRMPDTSRLVDRMCSKGLVTRVVSELDRRLVDISITDKGLDILRATDNNPFIHGDFITGITDEEARLLNDLLNKMKC